VEQLDAEKNIAAQMSATYDGYEQVHPLQEAIAERQKSLGPMRQQRRKTLRMR